VPPEKINKDNAETNTVPDDEDLSYEIKVNKKRYEAGFYQIPAPLDTVAIYNESKQSLLDKYTQEQLDNPTEEISAKIQLKYLINKYKYDEELLIYGTYGSAGNIAIRNGKFNIGRNCCGLRPKQNGILLEYIKNIAESWAEVIYIMELIQLVYPANLESCIIQQKEKYEAFKVEYEMFGNITFEEYEIVWEDTWFHTLINKWREATKIARALIDHLMESKNDELLVKAKSLKSQLVSDLYTYWYDLVEWHAKILESK
jgi:hypothetical protein